VSSRVMDRAAQEFGGFIVNSSLGLVTQQD
jgi:hypothetical protein